MSSLCQLRRCNDVFPFWRRLEASHRAAVFREYATTVIIANIFTIIDVIGLVVVVRVLVPLIVAFLSLILLATDAIIASL
jgi:hypothetical protein